MCAVLSLSMYPTRAYLVQIVCHVTSTKKIRPKEEDDLLVLVLLVLDAHTPSVRSGLKRRSAHCVGWNCATSRFYLFQIYL